MQGRNLFRCTVIVGLFIAVVSLSGCGGSTGNNGSTSGGNSGNTSLTVTAIDYSGNKAQGVAIVLGDSNGRMKAYGTTDANGQIIFNDPPTNATITAATSCTYSWSSITSNSTYVEYDVSASIVLQVNTCSGTVVVPPIISPLGKATVNVTSTLSDVKQFQITTPGTIAVDYDIQTSQQVIDITQSDLRDGKLSIIVIGKDANGTEVGYGSASADFMDGMKVDISIDKQMSFVQYQVTNIPATAVKLRSSIYLFTGTKGVLNFDNVFTLSSVLSSATISLPYIPDVSTQVNYYLAAYLDQDQDGTVDARQSLAVFKRTGSVSTQSFDLGTALSAPSNLAVSNANTATPTISWSGVDPRATSVYVVPRVSIANGSSWSLSFGQLSLSRTSITFPELPDSLADFRPATFYCFSLDANSFSNGIFMSSSGDYPNSPAVGISY